MMGRIVRILSAAIAAFVATAGALWLAVEVFAYFQGDQLKVLLDDYWFLAFILPPAIIALVVGWYADGKTDPEKLPEPGPPPCQMPDPLETKECRQNRREHNLLLYRFVQELNGKKTPPMWDPTIGESPTDPAFPPPIERMFVDCLSTVVTRHGQALVLIPSRDSQPDVEGVGRTSVVLRLLGITIPYGRLVGLDSESIEALDNLSIHFSSTPWCRLLASDIAYLGASGGRLTVIPTRGAVASLAWDLARHIYRSTELQYETGDHRLEPGRKRLLRIFQSLSTHRELIELFGKVGALYPVDEIVILRRAIEPQSSSPIRRELSQEEKMLQLRSSMLASTLHGSAFWRRNAKVLETRIDTILQSLETKRLPRVVEISYSHPSSSVPQNTFGEIADLITRRELAPEPEGNEVISTGIGIRFHNDALMRSMSDVDSIRLLLTSGEKLFKDAAFWRSLLERRRRLQLEILILDPDSSAAKERQRVSYQDKPANFLESEIRENIETIRRMAHYFSEAREPIAIQCAAYNDLPPFRITFIGRQRLLVTAYDEGKRTGDNTLFYDISTTGEGTLFQGLEEEYRRVQAMSKPIDLANGKLSTFGEPVSHLE